MLRKSADSQDASGDAERADLPSGGSGSDSDRDPRTGRFVAGNRASLVVGQSSLRFWSAADDARRDITAAVIADAGYTLDDAPRALRIACDGLAQAMLVRDSTFTRLVQDHGPTSEGGRVRRVFGVWAQACERVDRALRLVGLQRRPKEETIDDWFTRAEAEENAEQEQEMNHAEDNADLHASDPTDAGS